MEADQEYLVVLVTVPDRETGLRMGRMLVERRVAACVNIVDGVRSIYMWEGRVEEDNESLMIIKTSRSRFSELRDLIRSMHPYKVPEVIALPIVDGLAEYLNWIGSVVKG